MYNELGLKPEDLNKYDVPLVEFDRKTMILRRMIKLPVQMGTKVVEVDFIVVDAYFPYMTILVKPWFHAMGIVSFTLHVKVKYLTKGCVEELLGC